MSVHNKRIIALALLCAFSYGDSIGLLDKDGQSYDLSQKMSINMQDSDIKSVLMLIGELTGLNIVVSPAVKDTIRPILKMFQSKQPLMSY